MKYLFLLLGVAQARDFNRRLSGTLNWNAPDENGNLIDSIPIMFVGRPRTDKQLQAIDDKIAQVEQARKELCET